ncbi:MAG: M4 family metallopeptidase [Gammaproteobacteria bacterium]|nr:M4 family metallopeptidase [Gammaproteobacteria bacterium]
MRAIHRLSLYTAFLCAAAAAVAAPPDGGRADSGRVAALRAASSGDLIVATNPANDKARFVRSNGDLIPAFKGGNRHQKAMAFVDAHGPLLGIDNARQLRLLRSRVDSLGHTTLSYEQFVNDVPVYGARVNANFGPNNALRAVNGDFAPGLLLNTRPSISSRSARSTALSRIASIQPAAGLEAKSPTLYIYRQSLRANGDGPAVLAWQVEVGNDRDVREFVFVNAANGKIVDQHTGIYHALDRRVYDGGLSSGFLVWTEGNPTPFTGNNPQSINSLIDYTADAYYFFDNLTGGSFLSWDGNDSIMYAVNNEPAITCPNARWNGVSIDFCDGTSSDDVVGHEWSHAYTESTHGLIYRWQSGALNESYSDIFGETIDQLNTFGTDTPAGLRSVGVCSVFGGSTPPGFEVLSPATIAGGYNVAGAAFNPAIADVSGSLIDTASDGCAGVPGPVNGAIALIDRGDCTFAEKVLNAQSAGAIGAVIANNAGDDLVFMGGDSAGINIPSVFVSQSDGQVLRSESNVSANISLGSSGENSLRWLMGEDATSFGGAIRDMWAPECFGDPGKVSSGQYFCDGSVDQGGVHTNSGVPNHAFALLVDGGTYNGVAVNAIGLEKAANIYWRAASNYQTPTSDFGVHADSLEASCADLLGVGLANLSTESAGAGASGLAITANDCNSVAAAIAAVELRVEPVQCNFSTLLDVNAPDLCASGTTAQSVLNEDFETGLNGWAPGTRALLNPGTFSGPDWSVSADLPDGRSGSAAYGPNLVLGDCNNDIEAGIVYLQSPVIALPSGIATPRVAFDHSVMTEADYDGANLKISVNGGTWQLVPAGAFTFNAYNGSLVASDNPMAGEAAFHGTDEGSLVSGWGQSQISLTGIASPGDSIRLRFELGMDGCNGLQGWFVDDINVYSCEVAGFDLDGDGIPDSIDNCTNVPNADQRDTNGDEYGNICDADLDNSGLVDFLDLAIFKDAFLTRPASANWNPDADLDGDDLVGFSDINIAKQQFLGPPGPSGLAP